MPSTFSPPSTTNAPTNINPNRNSRPPNHEVQNPSASRLIYINHASMFHNSARTFFPGPPARRISRNIPPDPNFRPSSHDVQNPAALQQNTVSNAAMDSNSMPMPTNFSPPSTRSTTTNMNPNPNHLPPHHNVQNTAVSPRISYAAMVSKSVPGAVPSIQTIKITAESLLRFSSASSCSICMEEFALDQEATQLPCNHFFHRPCISPWLLSNKTCPLCRCKLTLTDQPISENQRPNFFPNPPPMTGRAYMLFPPGLPWGIQALPLGLPVFHHSPVTMDGDTLILDAY